MNTEAPPVRDVRQTAMPDVAKKFGSETIFVDSLDAHMRLYAWDARALQRPDLFHIVMMGAGSATLTLGGKISALSEGQILFLPPSNVFSLSCDPPVDGLIVAMTLSEMSRISAVSAAFSGIVSEGRPKVLGIDPEQPTLQRFQASVDLARDTPDEALLITHAALCEFIGRVLSEQHRYQLQYETAVGGTLGLVSQFRVLIERDYRQQKSLNDYCDALNSTERALRRATQRECAMTPLQMIHARSVLEAKRLLRFTNVSVAQIGVVLGFDDPAYFNRFFKKAAGESPRAWRVARARG